MIEEELDVLAKNGRRPDWKELMRKLEPYLWLLPTMIVFAVFTFYPFLETVVKSFFIIDSFGSIKKFVGWQNYAYIFQDARFLLAVKNTLIFVALTVPISKILGFLLALLANKRRRFSVFYETSFSLPVAVASSVIAMIFQLLFVPSLGLINGLFGLKVRWFTDPKVAIYSIAIVQIWLSTGYAFMFLLAAVRSIPSDVLENAELEGATLRQKMLHIYFPLTTPTMFYLLVSDLAFAMMMMGLVNILTQGGPQNSTITIMYYVYQQFAGSGNYTMANPAAIIAFLLTFVITMISFIWERRGVHY